MITTMTGFMSLHLSCYQYIQTAFSEVWPMKIIQLTQQTNALPYRQKEEMLMITIHLHFNGHNSMQRVSLPIYFVSYNTYAHYITKNWNSTLTQIQQIMTLEFLRKIKKVNHSRQVSEHSVQKEMKKEGSTRFASNSEKFREIYYSLTISLSQF